MRDAARPERRPPELYRALMISSGGLSDRLARLAKAGLVSRHAAQGDARSLLVQPTERRRRTIERLFARAWRSKPFSCAGCPRASDGLLRCCCANWRFAWRQDLRPAWLDHVGRARDQRPCRAVLLFDGAIKILDPAIVRDALAARGHVPSRAVGLGVLTLGATLLYAWPQTRLLGAVLLTGLFGGAVASHLRVVSPLLSLFGLYPGLPRPLRAIAMTVLFVVTIPTA